MPIELASVLITAAVSIGGSWLVARSSKPRQLLDQLQAAYSRITQLEARVDGLETKRDNDEAMKRAQADHIDLLEAHIWAELPPPPPPRPAGL